MFKKAKKFIKKDLRRRYEKLEERFLNFETRLYGRLEERMERLERQFDELSELIKDSLGGDEHEPEQETTSTGEETDSTESTNSKTTETEEEKELAESETPDADDDLKKLKGLGPALEQKLQQAGVFQFQQLAALTDQEIEAIEKQIPGFKQRYERYEWRAQAKEQLA